MADTKADIKVDTNVAVLSLNPLGRVISTAPEPDKPPVPSSPASDPRFLEPLVLEYIDGRNWKLISEFDYRTDVFPHPPIKILAGFLTDFASVPKLMWNILPPTGKYGKAAVVHDYLYRTKGIATKDQADHVFLEAMTALGVGWWTRNTMFRAVHWFGGGSYKGGL